MLQSIFDITTLFVVAFPLVPSENTVLTQVNTILTSILRKDHNIFSGFEMFLTSTKAESCDGNPEGLHT